MTRYQAFLQNGKVKLSGKPPLGASSVVLLEPADVGTFRVAAFYTYRAVVPKYIGATLRTGKAEDLRNADDLLREKCEGQVTVKFIVDDKSGYKRSIVKTMSFEVRRFIVDYELIITATMLDTNTDPDVLKAFRNHCETQYKAIKKLFSDRLDKIYGQKNYKYKLHKRKVNTPNP